MKMSRHITSVNLCLIPGMWNTGCPLHFHHSSQWAHHTGYQPSKLNKTKSYFFILAKTKFLPRYPPGSALVQQTWGVQKWFVEQKLHNMRYFQLSLRRWIIAPPYCASSLASTLYCYLGSCPLYYASLFNLGVHLNLMWMKTLQMVGHKSF